MPVSVVVPCYCCDSTVERAVLSVCHQVARPAEIFLVDDASPDDGRTLEKLHALKKKYDHIMQIHIIALPINVGAAIARNTAWDLASQPYIAFLDSDDAWHPRKLQIQYPYMEAHPEICVSGHAHRQLSDAFSLPDWTIDDADWSTVGRDDILRSNRFVTPSVMLRRDIPFRFEPRQRHMEDHLLWMHIATAGRPIVRLDAELTAIYKPIYGASGLSAQMWSMARADIGNYLTLYRKHEIRMYEWLILSVYASLKFVRRMPLYWMRRLGGKA